MPPRRGKKSQPQKEKKENVEEQEPVKEQEPVEEQEAVEKGEAVDEQLTDEAETKENEVTESEDTTEEMENGEGEGAGEQDEGAKKKKKKNYKRLHGDSKPTTEMIVEALLFYNETNKGSSIPAIKNHILQHNAMRPTYLPSLMKKALTKLQADGLIARPKGQDVKGLMTGRYKLTPAIKKSEAPRARPESLRKLDAEGQIRKGVVKKKKKKRRKAYY